MKPRMIIYGDFDDNFEEGDYYFVVREERENGNFLPTDTPASEGQKFRAEINVLHDCFFHWMAPEYRDWWDVAFHWPGENIPRKPSKEQIAEAKRPQFL